MKLKRSFLFLSKIKSPIGVLTLLADDQCLVSILWPGEVFLGDKNIKFVNAKNNPVLMETEIQLTEYFKGKRKVFDLPIEFNGTDFQNKVWKNLVKIPYGTVNSYLDIAKKIKQPKACRAVGAANGRNPLPIVVPCHRVIGSSGKLTGFAGGLKSKSILLDLEGISYKL